MSEERVTCLASGFHCRSMLLCSAVSRQLQEASAEALRELCERCFDDVDLLVIYLDGKDFGGHQVITAGGRGGRTRDRKEVPQGHRSWGPVDAESRPRRRPVSQREIADFC